MNQPKKVRWWPAILVCILGAASLPVIWLREVANRQDQVTATIGVCALSGLLLLLWLLFFSRLGWGRRILIFALSLLVLGAIGINLRVRGFTGDVVPVLAWRWSHAEAPAPPVAADSGRAVIELATAAGHEDFPQFLGPTRNGIVTGVNLLPDWQANPPQVLWRQPIGAGWSGFVVVGELALTQEQRGDQELVTCYRLATGELLWSHAERALFEEALSGAGPRATPSIAGGRVYAIGATGILNCLDLADGRSLWSHDILKETGAQLPTYGVCASPLVHGDLVIVLAGGSDGKSLVAYDRTGGQQVWAGGSDPAAYASPLVANLAGFEQVVVFNERTVCGQDLQSGAVLWSHAWSGLTQITAQPLPVSADTLLVSSGYGAGCRLLRITYSGGEGFRADLVWSSPGLKAKLSNFILHDGYIYGLDDGVLVCLDPADGQRKWKKGRFGHGQVLMAGGLLLVSGEKGEVILLEADPQDYHELGRLQAIEGKTWNHAALAGPYFLVRNATEAACLRLPENN